MAATLLNTRTTTFLELIGNGKIYRVPPYQRDYSWGEEQWEDLWADVQEVTGTSALHYMGALVVEARSDREFLIIDGQQRLATLSIFALAVLDKLRALADAGIEPENNRERATALRNRFLGEKDPASLLESSKLFLNETDDPFYQDYLIQLRAPLNPRGLTHSNKLLWECFQYFRRQLSALAQIPENGENLAGLLSETVGRQLMFILITVDDEINAYTVFETLNARGLELSATDLLKNYFFSRMEVPSDRAAVQRRWNRLIATVGQKSFPEFLRYHLLCELPHVRSQRLFKLIRARVRTAPDVLALLDALERRADLYAALGDPHHEFWADAPERRGYVRDLDLFRVRQMMPLLFAAWERFSPDDFTRILKLVVVLSFRYTVVSGLNTNPLEVYYHRAAKSILDGTATRPGQVFTLLRDMYVPDERFEQDFARLTFSTSTARKKLARYVLAHLEADRTGRAIDPETDPGTLEHILPLNPTAEWGHTFAADRWDSYVFRLGNLTLLEASLNRTIGGAPYPAKRAAYEQSRYALTRQVAEQAPEEWTPAHVDARARSLAMRATHLWRADFA